MSRLRVACEHIGTRTCINAFRGGHCLLCYRFCVVLYTKLLASALSVLNNAESLHLDVDLEAGTDLGEARFHRLFQTADEMLVGVPNDGLHGVLNMEA